MEEKDLLSELRSLGGQPEEQPEPEPEVGVSDTARQLEGEGLFSDLSRKHQIDAELSRDKAAMRSADSVNEPVKRDAAPPIQRVGNVPGLIAMPGLGDALDAVVGGVRDWHNQRWGEFQERRARSQANWDRLAEQERLKQAQEQPSAESLEATAKAVPGGLTDPQQYVEGVKGIVPGIVKAAGLTLQSPDVFAAKGQYGAAALGARQLEIMDRIDAGQDVAEADDPMGYRHMSPTQRVIARTDLEEAQARFAPTPVSQRSLYQAGEAVQEFGKGLVPASPGYEDAAGRQVGEGLGSLIFGLPVAYLGTIPATMVFGGMGVGEATQRAVEFDKKEKAEGRAGLSEDQIITAGLLGVGPGTTDVLPVEVLLGRIPLRIPPVLRGAVAQGVARIGGQAFIEGVQEAGQAFLQNLIAREVYDKDQKLLDGVGHEAQIGAGVGGIAQVAKDLGGWVLRSASGRRGHSHTAATPATEPQSQPSKGLDLDRYADENSSADTAPSAMETAPPIAGSKAFAAADGSVDTSGERLGTRVEFGEFLNLETQVMTGEATPEVEDRLEQFEEKLVEKFRETGLPGDEHLTERRPVDSVEDIRLAFASASEEEISRFWRGGTRPEAGEETTATQAAEPSSAQPSDLQRRFREIVAGNSPRSRWAAELGATPEQTETLIESAIREGVLRRDGRGRLMRTAKSRGVQLGSFRRPKGLRPEFVAAWPETSEELFAELDKWLPTDVFVQVRDKIQAGDMRAFGMFDPATGKLLLDASLNIREAFQVGAHESTHALRFLYTDKEWATLLDYARKNGFEGEVDIEAYRRSYTEQLLAGGAAEDRVAVAVQELIDQEVVATMAQFRILEQVQFPNRIAKLLDRIAKFFEALRNVLQGRGFQTFDDVFERFKSGEVGARGTADESWQRWHDIELGDVNLPDRIHMGEEQFKRPEEIVNPIDPNAPVKEQLRQIAALTAENKPALDAQLSQMDELLGTTSNANVKKAETIVSKASRPSILATKPWHQIAHIRDTLRFQTKISTFDQIEQASEFMLSRGYRIVKIDTAKMLEPKEWGWRFAGFDLRAPNGQLVEWYIIFDEMYQAKKEGHLIFEKWRNATDAERQARQDEYETDVRRSRQLYRDAFEAGLRKSGYADLEAARADISSLSASLPEISAKLSDRSSAEGGVYAPRGSHGPSASARKTDDLGSSATIQQRPVSRSSSTSGSAMSLPSGQDFVNSSTQLNESNSRANAASIQQAATKRPFLPNPIRMGQGKGAGLEVPKATLTELVEDVNEALGLTTRHGRLDPGLKASAGRQGKRVAGQFSTLTGVTRIATPNDIATLAHEGGHALESRADIKTELEALKQAHIEELTTHPAIDVAPRQLAPGGGYSGVDLDADTQRKLIEAVVTDRTWRQLATVAGQSKSGNWAGRKHNNTTYISAQEAASKAWGMLVRRVGSKRAKAYLDDVRQHVPASTAPNAYVRTRFSASGVPRPRPAATATPTQLSEGFAEWFRLYLTKPKEAFRLAPAFVLEFEDILDGADPGLLEKLEGVQKGFQALLDASPAGAVRSRVQSTVQGGRISRFRKEVGEKGLRATISDRMYSLYTAAVDGKHPMKRAVRYLIETAETNLALGPQKQLILKAINDPYKRWRLAEHSRVWATNILQNGIRFRGEVNATGPSFHEALTQAFGGTRRGQWNEERAEIFGSYLVARRMLAEFARHDRGETDNQPDALIEKRVWARARNDIEKAYPEFKMAAETLYRFNKNHLRLKHEAGFIGRDLFLELQSREDYVPLNRIMDDGGPSQLGKGAKGQNKRKLIYRFKGSTRDFINPIETIVQDVYATQGRIALNDTIATLDRLARAAGPGGGAIAERIPASDMQGVTVDLREVVKSAARDLSESDAEGLVELIDDLFDQEASATIFRATPTNEKGEPIVYLWEEGKRVPIRLGDDRIGRDLFEGFVGFGQQASEWWVDTLALGTQAFRAGVTRAPAYILVNFLRDQLATAALSPGYIPFVTGAKGLKHAIADDATAKAYKSFAGLSGVESGLAEAAANADVLTLRRKGFTAAPTTWARILRATEVTEVATRMGHFKVAYDRAIADGMAEEEAAVEAAFTVHDVLDFSRKGAKMGTVVRFVAFLNAAGQALDAARRTFRGDRNLYRDYTQMASPFLKAATGSPLSVAERAALPNSLRIWIALTTIGMIGVILKAVYSDDDEYEEFNDYMKATHWFFKLGGVWWRVPKPFELAVLSNAYEAAFDRYWKQDPRALTLFLESLRHTVTLPADVQGLAALGKLKEIPQAAWEAITGTKDPYKKRGEDNPVPTHLRRLPPEMQFTAYTSELGRLIGKTLGWSPAKVDAFISDTFATLGRDVMAASDQVLPAINRNIGGVLPGVSRERADKSLEDHWIISRFTRREARGALSTQTFWQEMSRDGGRMVQAAEGYKEMLRAGKEHEARQFLNRLKPEEKAFALLRGHFQEKDADIHPLHRAQQVMSAMAGVRKDMLLERLYVQSTMPSKTHRARDPERIVLSPSKQKVVNEILEDLSMREARNALIVMKHPGWAQKRIMPTAGLIRELEAAAPAVAEELGYRLTKGRNKVYPFQGVRKAWAIARDELLKEGADAELSEARGEARWANSDGDGPLAVLATK